MDAKITKTGYDIVDDGNLEVGHLMLTLGNLHQNGKYAAQSDHDDEERAALTARIDELLGRAIDDIRTALHAEHRQGFRQGEATLVDLRAEVKERVAKLDAAHDSVRRAVRGMKKTKALSSALDDCLQAVGALGALVAGFDLKDGAS